VRDLVVPVADHQLVHAARRRFAGAAEAVGQAGQRHQFKRNVFKRMADPGAFVEAAEEAAMLAVVAAVFDHARQPGFQTVHKAGQSVARKVLEFADVDPGFEAGRIGPDARPAQADGLENDDVFFLHADVARLRFTVRNY